MLLERHPSFARQTLLRVTSLSHHLGERFTLLATHQVRGRLYAELLRLMREHGSSDDPTLTLEFPTDLDLASLLATGRSNSSKCLKELNEQGIIGKCRRGSLRVHNPEDLELLLSQAEMGNDKD